MINQSSTRFAVVHHARKFFVSSGRNPKKFRGKKIKGTYTRSKGQDFKKQKMAGSGRVYCRGGLKAPETVITLP